MTSHSASLPPAPLSYEALSKRFGQTIALKPLTLTVEPGEFVGIIGPSGAGKSTLLRLTNRLIEPTSGRIRYGDLDVTGLRGNALRHWRASAAMIFQQFNLVPRLDVLTNVLIGTLERNSGIATLFKQFGKEERARAILALDRLGMADAALQRADSLSGGQQQRVAIARALLQDPRLILADEPIASLDPNNARAVMDALKEINKSDGITVMCNLHTLVTAREYCHRIVGLNAGAVVYDGPPAKLDRAALAAIYGDELSKLEPSAVA
ncbi:MAG: phosphonate ABC transporter ATP-binding protein [Alphaproteobacteria bacterium]